MALDADAERVAEARGRGLPVYFGDSRRVEVLHAAGASRASAAVITLDDPAAAERAVAAVRREAATVPVLARARYPSDSAALKAAGATAVVPELVEGSLQMGGALLEMLGEPRESVNRVLDAFRDEEYARLGAPVSPPSKGPSGERVLAQR